MNLKETITADVKAAMKNKEADKLATLRFLLSAIKNKEIEVRPQALTEEDVLSVVKKSVKQRKDSIAQYEDAGRADLAEKEKLELRFIEGYLPETLSQEKLEMIIQQVITEMNATDMKQMGAVMKEVLTKTQGAADAKMASQLVKERLS